MMRFRTLTCDCLLLSVHTHTVRSKNRKCFAIFLFPHLNKKENDGFIQQKQALNAFIHNKIIIPLIIRIIMIPLIIHIILYSYDALFI